MRAVSRLLQWWLLGGFRNRQTGYGLRHDAQVRRQCLRPRHLCWLPAAHFGVSGHWPRQPGLTADTRFSTTRPWYWASQTSITSNRPMV